MKNTFFVVVFLLLGVVVHSQEKPPNVFEIEADAYYGSILEHNPDIAHLITEHPQGLILSYNRKTFGYREAERRYNYPDWGFTFTYQDFNNPVLGENYGLYAHMNWYFLNRNLVFRMGQGVAYTTNPYDPETNFENNAFGSDFLSTTFLKLNYVRENLWEGLGFHAGFSIIHYSNANFRAPNNSTNTWAFNAGLSYLFDHENVPQYMDIEDGPSNEHAERIKYNLIFRYGWNESDVVGQGQFPFWAVSAYADKRINYKSTLQLGVDYFDSKFLEEFIRYRTVAFPEDGLTGDEDYRRAGIFVGHELNFYKTAFVSQIGYYVYWPYEFENRWYNRLGLKRYVYKDKLFAIVTVKAHWAKAEGVEFGIGVRL
ncbi:acyloxyacyl hydrolase [Aureisphaera galaxeae]|uniref:acyloxyacyl hydrolase n=1 Tax=Aureisphaera galaxeae TaxID=1538023 RepID=UPI0023506726|nr:acyloxyacyl hydrolase [Aureisphaera galaxeae]MDC8003162.1 acyloxyacyl hydrolase [Aureisphaera galaxeae]